MANPHKPIIIIDDDSEDLELTKELAAEIFSPSEVLTFDNPEAAFQFLTSTHVKPLFILCDINMPKMDGFQLRAKLLKEEPDIAGVPFLFLSTSRTDREVILANELEVVSYYTKAVNLKGMKLILEDIFVLVKDRK